MKYRVKFAYDRIVMNGKIQSQGCNQITFENQGTSEAYLDGHLIISAQTKLILEAPDCDGYIDQSFQISFKNGAGSAGGTAGKIQVVRRFIEKDY